MTDRDAARGDALRAVRITLEATRSAPTTSVRVHNRLMNEVRSECARLAATPAGRETLARAAESDADPLVRLNAALAVEAWDPNKAAETFVALIAAAGGAITRPMTMTTALTVHDEVGRAAALCLLNFDRRNGAPAPPLTRRKGRVPSVTAPRAQLNAAEAVYSLAMNGGLDHAYAVAGAQFAPAAAGFEAVGAIAAAHVLREALRVVGASENVPDTSRAREKALRVLPAQAQRALAALGDRFSRMDDLMERLESATDG